MPVNAFVGSIASGYDNAWGTKFDAAVINPIIDVLAALTGNGRALEFGIGTGRIALPLAARGVPVHGIDLSADMLDQLRSKPDADAIEASVGDFATTRVEGTFRVVYLVANTLTNLTTQDEQVACFRNAADHLEPGGAFVVDVFIPDLRSLLDVNRERVFARTEHYIAFDIYTDRVAQRMSSHHWWIGDDGRATTFSAPFRYVWPSELDLMAQLAGMTLESRWSNWQREPFTGESASHVSIWRKDE